MRDAFSPYIFDLSNRVALVTGASSGLGARMAKVLAAHGAKVALAARRIERLEALKEEIEKAGGSAMCVSLDVSSEDQTIAAYDAIEAEFGVVNTVIANAGVSTEVSRATDTTVAQADQLYEINTKGVFLTAREGAKRMMNAGTRETEMGRIVLISSITSFDVNGNLALYSGTKAGVSQMGKVLALDWARMGINVNMIAPGYIETEINEGLGETEVGKRMIGGWPRRRMADPDALDGAVLFLCSDQSRQVTGTVMTIDDGQSLG